MDKNFSDFFENQYRWACSTVSDINEHLSVLYDIAQQCNHVTEFGVRTGMSTRAFLNTNTVLRAYDLNIDDNVNKLFVMASQAGKNVKYIQADVLNIDIEQTDLLFIDTWHIYEQLKQELARHAKNVRKYIAFHDTYTFGLSGENGSDRRGLLSAIIEFLMDNPEWKFKIHRTNNNGLTVLERQNHE